MMVVMSVIAVALHLIETLREDGAQCQMFILQRWDTGSKMKEWEL